MEEEARLSALAEAVVEAYVHVFLELPAVAYAEVGQHAVGAYGAELAEHRARSGPYHHAVAPPQMLTQLNLRRYLVLVALESRIISAKGIRAA